MRRTSMFYGYQDDYIQVVAKHCDMGKLEALGFVHILVDLPESKIVTMEESEHSSIIAAMTDKDAIEDYVKGVNGVDIDKRGGLDTVKEKALKALKDGNGS